MRSSLSTTMALVVAMSGGLMGVARGEGTVTTNSTAALLQAMAGGGLVRLNIGDVLTLETPVIVAADTILENGATVTRTVAVSGGGNFRLFHVLPGIRFEVRNLLLREGLATQGGAIFNEGVLFATNVTFTGCEAAGPSGEAGADGGTEFGFGDPGGDGGGGLAARGGAIFNTGEATLVDCAFNVNEANGGLGGDGGKGGAGSSRVGPGGDGGAGAPAYGGAVSSTGRLVVERCVFAGNAARGGDGGIGGSNGSAQGAGHGGAGAFSAGGAVHSSGWLLISASSFTTNLVAGGESAAAGAPEFNIGLDGPGGGHAWGGAVASWSTGIVVNTTFYTNLMAGGRGGDGATGTFIVGDGGAGGNAIGSGLHARGWLAVTNATFAWNTGTAGAGGAAGPGGQAATGAAGRLAGGGLAVDSGTEATVLNSILATTGMSTVDGPVVDAGHNLFTDAGTGRSVPGSIYGTDPLLGAYRVWSVGTPGCLPLSGSPAVDRASADASPALDQRGLPRPGGFGPDIGAFEVGSLTWFISGQVLNGSVGVPGVGVRVGTNTVATDAVGGFRFGPFPTGFYTVELEGGGVGFTPRLVQLALSADVTNVVFRAVRPSLVLVHDAVPGSDTLTGTGTPNGVYQLQGSADLVEWAVLATVAADSQGRVAFTHAPGTVSQWFYRLASTLP